MSGELRVGLDAPLPAELGVGRGTVLLVAGWCWAPGRAVRALRLVVDGAEQPVLAERMPRRDRADADGEGAHRSGFWGLARISPAAGSRVAIGLRDDSGAHAHLGTIAVRAPEVAVRVPAPADGPLVAICMATHDPPVDLLRGQLESIRGQTHRNWVCVISDDHSRPERYAELQLAVGGDPRFLVSRSPRRLGFLGNFERALELAPREADFVALADQDDRWHADKLAALLEAIGAARLAYSDARVVTRTGEVLSSSFWERRRNNHRDLFRQLVANAVTGAASLFPRGLLDDALPFPPGQWRQFHDHWLGLVALASGDVAYVDRSLYDYVQHGGATIGHAAANRMPTLRDRWKALRRDGRRRVRLWRRHYFVDALRLLALADLLELRLGGRIVPRKRRALGRLRAAERSPVAVAGLFARGARELAARRPQTLGAEWMLGHAFLWRALAGRAPGLDALPPEGLGLDARREAATLPADVAGVAGKIAPLELRVADAAPARINVLIPDLDLRHFFGGYIGKLNLALRLARRGRRVRVLATDTVAMLPADWRRARETIERYAGLAGLFEEVEVALGRAPGGVEVSPGDRFVATTWWTAHLAEAARRELGGPPFLYLVQEYEPFTFPNGTWGALAERSYRLEHRALYSTKLLREFFAQRGLAPAGALAFANAITPVEPAPALTRRLLLYARPEPHAARNLYELALLALREALSDGAFAGWELRGIGTTALGGAVPVGDAELVLAPRAGQADYAAMLAGHDVGLALMHTPHPSLVPIEMAAAGLVAVTSTYANKTAAAMAAISPNILAAEPTIEAVAGALREAERRAADTEARRAGAAATAWPRSWDEALPDRLLDRVLALIDG